jgi:hypothetical protein
MSETRIASELSKEGLTLVEPTFRKESELSLDQRTDPDYRLKELQRLSGKELSLICSKCHHCRR